MYIPSKGILMPDPATPTLPDSKALITDLMTAGNKLAELRSKKVEDRGDSWAADVRSAVETIHQLDPLLKVVERHEAAERAALLPKGPDAALDNPTPRETRSAGAQFTESDGYKNRSGVNSQSVQVRALISTEQTDPAGGLFMPRGTPIPPVPRTMRLFVRDVLSVQETGLNSIPYIRELNPATNEGGATAVAEGAAKPEVTMQFVGVDAPVQVIAAWIPVTRQIIEDAPTLRGYIDTRLAYMLALREEAQVLNGSGTSPNLRGIRQTTGLQTQAFSVDRASTLGLAIGKIENVDGDPDAVAMNPIDFWAMMTTRSANQFDGGFGAGLPFGPAPRTIWGLTTIRTRSMESGVALVGSYALGATLFDRQETTIRTYEQHASFATENKVLVLAEERVALAVHRPDFFVEADVAP